MCDLRPSFNTVIRNITLQIAGTIAASTPNSSPWHCLQGGPAKESRRRTRKAKDTANLRVGRQKERERKASGPPRVLQKHSIPGSIWV